MLSMQAAQRIDLQDARIIFQNEDVWAEYEQQLYAPQIDVKMIWLENGVKRKWLKFGWLKSRTDQLCVEPQRASPQGGITACFESMGSSYGPVWPLSSPPSHNICIFTHSLLPESQQKRLYLCTIFSHAYDWKVLSMVLQCAFQSSEFKKKIDGNRKT